MKGHWPTTTFYRRASGVLAVFLLVVLNPQPLFAASRASYYDWGPYYTKSQVLGFTFSSLEKLTPPALPAEAVPPKATGILPGNPLHGFETFVENVQLTLTFDPVKREEMRLSVAEERLSEAATLASYGKADLAAEAAASYRDTMQAVSENVADLAKQRPAGFEALTAKAEAAAATHAIAAQSLALSAPPNIASTWNTIVDASEVVMDKAADAQGKPAIPEDLSTSIQKLKNQGLITPEESTKLYGLGNRSVVRQELDKLTASGQFPIAEVNKIDQAVAVKYPTVYKEINNAFEFAELRTYETLPPPTDKVLADLKKWQDQGDNTPPPVEIKPYLYYPRAQELAKTVDLSTFGAEQQAEVAKFYPTVTTSNPTFATPSATPQPSPTLTPVPSTTQAGAPAASSAAAIPQPTPGPTPQPPSTEPYLAQYSGSLPGDPTYFFKQLGEQFSLATTFNTKRRLELAMHLAEERLREANALGKDEKKAAVYEATLKRYKDAMESVAENVKDYSGSENDKLNLAQNLEVEAARHNVVFEKGLLPQTTDTKIYADVIKTTENALDKCADALDRPALPAALSNRLQDLKAQGLLLPEEVEELTKATSREQIREKVRSLTEQGTFPPADAKKLDEAQSFIVPHDYNQLTEVRKVEELQRLRGVQAEFAQTATLRSAKASYEQQVSTLINSIDPSVIKPEDLAGREGLVRAYQNITATAAARPINGGQFGSATGSATTQVGAPGRRDAVLGVCPIGAVFKQFEGCVWENNGKRLSDYDQYRCDRGGQYWSFSANRCVAYDPSKGSQEDGRPSCPVGYTWSWEAQVCQAFAGGGSILPTPRPEASPSGRLTDAEIAERSKSCPSGSSYQAPKGCVWDTDGQSVYNSKKYTCLKGQYYSFSVDNPGCKEAPKEGEPFPADAAPNCKEANTAWSWSEGKCIAVPEAVTTSPESQLRAPAPSFTTPDSPFYFLKRAVEAVQSATAFTAQAREQVRLAHAQERFAEAYYSLEKKQNEDGFEKALAEYTGEMQHLYNDVAKGGNLSDSAKKALGEKLAAQSSEQNLLLEKAAVIASPKVTTSITAAAAVTVQGIDRASDLKGEPPVTEEIKAKIEALPKDMIPEEEKNKLLNIDNRVEARLKLGSLVSSGILTTSDTAFLNAEAAKTDPGAVVKLGELKKLDQIVNLSEQTQKIGETVQKTEDIAKKIDDFQKTFKPGDEIPADVRPYVRLTRIEEVAKTIRPDLVNLEDFGNRKDVQLAVATLKEEFKPTREAFKQLEDFRRQNPGKPLPFELARVEALSFGLGVRDAASPCFLPSPPFAPNTPCPAPGAAIPVASYGTNVRVDIFPYGGGAGFGTTSPAPSLDKDGKPLVYGKGPTPVSTGVCSDGYHWMYDNGGWCMSNSGSYGSGAYVPPFGSNTGYQGYTPYSSYYSAPGVPPVSYGYQGPGTYGAPYYGSGGYPYTPPTYYGPAPTTYTTNPPAGTVPGTGPAPTAPGQCPAGFHWMSDSGGWCMSNGGTYTPSGTGGYGGSVVPPYPCYGRTYWSQAEQKCVDGSTSNIGDASPNDGCQYGYDRDPSRGICIPNSSGSYSSSPASSCGPNQYWSSNGCLYVSPGGTPGVCAAPSSGCGFNNYWDGATCSCRANTDYRSPSSQSCSYPAGGCGYSSYYDWGSCSCRSTGYTTGGNTAGGCQPPYSGCGYNSSWDYGSCTCRSNSTYGGGSGPSATNYCQGISCYGGTYLDYSTCSCKSSTTPSSGGSGTSCNPPSGGCGSGWFDYGSCSCKQASSQGCYNVSASSCGSGFYWDSAACTCRSSGTTSSGGSTTSTGSCPSGYHWMSDNGGWCMSDGAASGGSTSPTPAPSTSTSTSTTTTTTTTSPTPAPTTSEPAPSTAPAPSTSTTTTTTTTSPTPAP